MSPPSRAETREEVTPAVGRAAVARGGHFKRERLLDRLRRSPAVRKVFGYSAGSVVAAFTSELAFGLSYGWGHVGTTWASLIGFIGGAIPNYILNRRWAWSDRNGRDRRTEIALYVAVSLATFAASAVSTAAVEGWARGLTTDSDLRFVLVAAAYLAVAGVFFVGKFVIYELVVFTKGPDATARAGETPAAARADRPAPS